MTEEIKPCPFCDSNESSIIFYYDFAVRNCDKCEMQGPPANNETLANISWNQRPYDYDMPAIVKKVQQLVEQNKQFQEQVNYYRNQVEKISKIWGVPCKQPE